ncbi:hypothetical protein H4582DRAFT_461242 [Lactarius indigo]|nr:hypothetical protein H4582DRAFT_461242 [Lactarius indigo]
MSPIAQRHLWGLESMQSSHEGTCSLDADPAIGSQFVSVSVPLDQLQCLPGSPHEASTADPSETQAYSDTASQFPPPELVLFTGVQGAEQPGHGSASEKHVCWRCRKVFKRIQEIARHAREVHDPPRQCPLCPFQWKRAYKIQKHLISAHHKEFTPVVEGIRILRGQDVVRFVETFEFLRNFELPETTVSLPPFHTSGSPPVPVMSSPPPQ